MPVLSEARTLIRVVEVGDRDDSGAREEGDRMSLTAFEYAALCEHQYPTKENPRIRSEQRRQEQEQDTGSGHLESQLGFLPLEREEGVFSTTSDSPDPFGRPDSNPGSRGQSSWIPFDVKRARSVQQVRIIGPDITSLCSKKSRHTGKAARERVKRCHREPNPWHSMGGGAPYTTPDFCVMQGTQLFKGEPRESRGKNGKPPPTSWFVLVIPVSSTLRYKVQTPSMWTCTHYARDRVGTHSSGTRGTRGTPSWLRSCPLSNLKHTESWIRRRIPLMSDTRGAGDTFGAQYRDRIW
ncbi:hypothetical protein DFH09DRAFT_1090407 [Mycena vulgaris]|nr:hypothetical protein DFH09DRAFT_1090407 [Mycena vulgaris]